MEGDYSMDLFVQYIAERWENFVENVNIGIFIYRFVEMVLVLVFDSKGKMSILSPLVNALVPSVIIYTLTTIQFFYGAVGMKGWAKGNIVFIALQIFSLVNSALALLLLYEIEWYIYDLRILRWIWWPVSAIFLVLWGILAA